jgi:MFS transporter, SHS family, lactate transporter
MLYCSWLVRLGGICGRTWRGLKCGKGFNFLSHGSQGLYVYTLPTSRRPKGSTDTIRSSQRSSAMSALSSRVSLASTFHYTCIFISSSFHSGGAIAGSISQHIGRRLTIILFDTLRGVFIPLWIIPSGFSTLAAGAFCVQFGVQGAWGVIPIQLAEMSPPGFRATFPGVAYQIGNVR